MAHPSYGDAEPVSLASPDAPHGWTVKQAINWIAYRGEPPGLMSDPVGVQGNPWRKDPPSKVIEYLTALAANKEWLPPEPDEERIARITRGWPAQPAEVRKNTEAWLADEGRPAGELLQDIGERNRREQEHEARLRRALDDLNAVAAQGHVPTFGRPHGSAPDQALARDRVPAAWFDERSQLDFGGQLDQVWPDQHRVIHGFRDVRFPADIIRARWPDPAALPKLPDAKSRAEPAGDAPQPAAPRGRGGRPLRIDWEKFWIEVTLRVYETGIETPEKERALTQHMQEWAVQNLPRDADDPGHPDTIRKTLANLYAANRTRPNK